MASEPVSTSVPVSSQLQPFHAWVERLGISGKLLAIGGLIGFIAVFFPLLSMSMQMPAIGGKAGVSMPAISSSQSMMVVGDWRGVLCLLGYVAAFALAFVLYPPNGLGQKSLAWAGVGVGGFIALLALWLLILAVNGSAGLVGFGASIKISVGFGAIVNVLAGATVAAGGFLKAREVKLF
jgi:hypothetical protein